MNTGPPEPKASLLQAIKRRLRRYPAYASLARLLGARQVVLLETRLRSSPRYGHGRPVHRRLYEILDRNRAAYEDVLDNFLRFTDQLVMIPVHPRDASQEPCWINSYLPSLDAASIYSFLAPRNASRYFEIGSGNSTRFARRSVNDHRLRTTITSIDPQPRRDIDAVCDRAIRQGLGATDVTIFDELDRGDVLFIDGSHRCLMNSDVTVAFLEILPRLKPGVLVGFHDVCLPEDYPPEYAKRYYSEQYILAAHLLAESPRFEIILPSWFVSMDPQLRTRLDPVWKHPRLAAVRPHGSSFWMQVKG